MLPSKHHLLWMGTSESDTVGHCKSLEFLNLKTSKLFPACEDVWHLHHPAPMVSTNNSMVFLFAGQTSWNFSPRSLVCSQLAAVRNTAVQKSTAAMPHQKWLHVAIMRHDKTVLAEYSLPLCVHLVPPKIPKARVLAKYVPGTKTAWKRASWPSWPPSAETLQNVMSYWKRDVSSSGLEKEGLGVNLYGDAERHRILICCCGCLPAATATVTAANRMQQIGAETKHPTAEPFLETRNK